MNQNRAVANLTKRSVDAITAGETRHIVWDRDLKGFGLRIETTGVKTFIVRYRAGGGRRSPRRQLSIGRFGAVTVEQARQRAKCVLGEVAQGKDPALERTDARGVMTVKELCELYLHQGVATKKESTLKVDLGRIKRHIVPLLGNRQITSIASADIEKFLKDVAEGKTAITTKTKSRGKALVKGGRGTASRTVGLLGGIFTFAVKRKLLSDNPVRGVMRYPDGKNETFLTLEELRNLGTVLSELEREGENPTGIACLRLLAMTGARKSEVVRLRWDEVDIGTSCLRLRDSKTGGKIIPLGKAAADLIEAQPKSGGSIWVFPSSKKDGDTPYAGLEKIWQKIRMRLSNPIIRIHDLRHSFASVAVTGGTSLPVIGAILGHREVSTTQRYAHLTDNPVRTATDLISGRIESALAGENSDAPAESNNGYAGVKNLSPQDIETLIQGLRDLLPVDSS